MKDYLPFTLGFIAGELGIIIYLLGKHFGG